LVVAAQRDFHHFARGPHAPAEAAGIERDCKYQQPQHHLHAHQQAVGKTRPQFERGGAGDWGVKRRGRTEGDARRDSCAVDAQLPTVGERHREMYGASGQLAGVRCIRREARDQVHRGS